MAEDFNSMQGSLGLDMGPPTPSVTPTSSVPIPETKHPGQASVELAQQTRFDAEQTRQAVMPMTMPTGGVYNPAMAGMLPGGNPAAVFGAQYAQNMQAISAGYMNPYGASMYGMGPVPGFNSGMMPSAGGLTDPSYGIYRTRMPGGFGMPAYPGIPREPLFGGPFYQGLASQMYTNPMDAASDLGMMRSAQYHGAATAALSGTAQLGFGLAGGSIGASLGTAAGAYLGGPAGAKIGGFVGGLAGGVIADTTIGRAAGEFLEQNPLTNLAQRTAQIQAISSNFIAGGPNVGLSGRGLDSTSAQDVARTLQKTGYAESTGFNAADLTKIFDQGSQAGLFDSVRDVSQIKGKVMSVAGTLKQFMELTNDADVTNAIKELGNMRTMGLSLSESVSAAQNARMFARSAGTSLQAINAAGQGKPLINL